MSNRGALLVFEGCDRAGKSTQVKLLVEALNERKIPAEMRAFPDRRTPIGQVLDAFLSKKEELPAETVHLLFSANRWECREDLLRKLKAGVTLVVDRYAASGAAYTAANTGRSLSWCREPDRGLPKPDLVTFLKVSESLQRVRSEWGQEKFENSDFQQRVAANYERLVDDTWHVLNADRSAEEVHRDILQRALEVIERAKGEPVRELYEENK